MLWKMSGRTENAESGWTAREQYVETYVEADSMDEAFEKARTIYGNRIDTAQPAEQSGPAPEIARAERRTKMPSRYWEPGSEKTERSEEEAREAEDWIKENGIPYDEDLPFN